MGVQTFLGYMMAQNSIEAVTLSETSANSWSDKPTGEGAEPLANFLPFDTTYFYCWDAAGKITHQDESPAPC